jgi:hypothetical protein
MVLCDLFPICWTLAMLLVHQIKYQGDKAFLFWTTWTLAAIHQICIGILSLLYLLFTQYPSRGKQLFGVRMVPFQKVCMVFKFKLLFDLIRILSPLRIDLCKIRYNYRIPHMGKVWFYCGYWLPGYICEFDECRDYTYVYDGDFPPFFAYLLYFFQHFCC